MMGLAAWGTSQAIAWWMPIRTFAVASTQVGVSIAVALVVLDTMARLLHIAEYVETRQAVLGRLARMRAS
jgi:hypothetical protein